MSFRSTGTWTLAVRLTVVSLSSAASEPQTISNLESPRGIPENGEVLFAPAPLNASPYYLDVLLQAAAPDWALINDLTVIGLHLGPNEEFPTEAFDDLHRRVLRGSVYALRLDENGEPVLIHVKGEATTDLDHEALIAAIRACDVTAMLNRPGASLPAVRSIHYEGPGGAHYRAFVRPGFALRGPDDLDRVSFWLVKDIIRRPYVVVDHWSMTALAHHAAEYARKFIGSVDTDDATRILDEFSIANVASYVEDINPMVSRFQHAFPVPGDQKVLVLLSATSSGNLAHRIVTALGMRLTRPEILALAQAPIDGPLKVQVRALTQLDDEYRRLDTPCPDCEPGAASTALPIHPESYLLHLSAYTHKTAIRAATARPAKDVIQRYAELGAFRVHRTHKDQRHHAYYVDVEAMLPSPEFAKRLTEIVAQVAEAMPTIDVIVHPPWPASSAFAERVADELQRVGAERPELHAFDDQVDGLAGHAALVNAKTVLIVDDVLITGRRIYAYRRQLIHLRREAGLDGRVELGALVAVARPTSEGALIGMSDVVHHTLANPRFFMVETLMLPNWSETECPWCRELQILRRIPEGIQNLPAVKHRITALKNQSQSELLWHWPPEATHGSWPSVPANEDQWREAVGASASTRIYSNDYFDLNRGGIFGDLQDSDLFVCIAATLQEMRRTRVKGGRIDSPLDDRFRSPIAKVLDPHLYLVGRFYEPVLLAGIMRACRPHDLVPPEGDADVELGLKHHLQNITTSAELYGELLIQVALGLIPPIREFFDQANRADGEDRAIALALLQTRIARG